MPTTITWNGTLTATASIAHGGETRGTITLLRRELIVTPDGGLVHVPIISGNSLRGRLRRVGEELLRDALDYEGLLHPAAAHALRGGGALAKTGREPLSGSRLQNLRALVPQVAVFGTAGGGTIIDGCLDVGKVIPHVTETDHITGATSTRSTFTATQLEAYTRQDDTATHDFAPTLTATPSVELVLDPDGRPDTRPADASRQMVFNVETFPAGTTFTAWLRLRRPTDLELSFFCDVLQAYTADARLGGRVAVGHGQVRVDLHPTTDVTSQQDWRAFVRDRRDEVLTALEQLA